MKQIRYWLAAYFLWLFLLYNIERLSEPINLASFVYVFTLASGLAILFLRFLQRIRLYWLFLLAMPPYLLLKMWLGYSLLGKGLPLTVTEICAIWFTIFLSWQITKQIREINETVYRLIIGHNHTDLQPFEIRQSQIYREIRRARQHQEPGSLIAVSVNAYSLQANFDQIIQKLKKELAQRYANAQLSKLLLTRLHSTDIVSQRNNHFVVFLPETGKAETAKVAARIQNMSSQDLGLTVNIGVSTFPDDATTFEGLLSIAEGKMVSATSEPGNGRIVLMGEER